MLSVVTQLPSEAITVIITDKFNHQYIFLVDTDTASLAVLDLDELPPGLLNPYAGDFQLFIENNGLPVPFEIDDKEYDCLLFHVEKYFGYTNQNYVIDVYGTAKNNGYY